VACQAIQSLSLLLFNTKQDDMLHFMLSQNLINDLLFFDMDVDGEEVGREGGRGGRTGRGGGRGGRWHVMHYLLSQNLVNNLMFFDMDVDGEEVRKEG